MQYYLIRDTIVPCTPEEFSERNDEKVIAVMTAEEFMPSNQPKPPSALRQARTRARRSPAPSARFPVGPGMTVESEPGMTEASSRT